MSAKVPITVACSLITFGLGALVGIVVMESVGYQFNPYAMQPSLLDKPGAPSAAPVGMPAGGRAGGGGGGGGGRNGPSPKIQLAMLVAKLDQLTAKPLAINLKADEKKKVQEQLSGLSEKDEISDDDAKKRYDALIKIIEPHKETMQAAGFRWPGGGGPGGGRGGQQQSPANPFKDGDGNKHLKSLDATLGKA